MEEWEINDRSRKQSKEIKTGMERETEKRENGKKIQQKNKMNKIWRENEGRVKEWVINDRKRKPGKKNNEENGERERKKRKEKNKNRKYQQKTNKTKTNKIVK